MKQYLFFAPLFIFVFGALSMQFYSSDELKATKTKMVDLSNRNLESIPDSYKEQILEAEVLLLDGNQIINLPSWLNEAKSLIKISLDNNPDFDFFQFSVDFQGMTQIEEISASNCNIINIPYQLVYFNKLRKLDLSSNSIKNIPYHFGFLIELEEVDLSNNQISEIGYSFRDLQKMKSLDISSNENLDINQFVESMEYREMDYLKIDFNDSIPDHFSTLTLKNADFTLHPNTKLNNQLSGLKSSSLVLRNKVMNTISDELIKQLVANKKLEQLSFVNFAIPKIPSELTPMKNLKLLGISSSGLNSIAGLEDMSFLQSLSIQENELDLNQIKTLKEKLTSCRIESDEDRLNGKSISYTITPPIKNYKNPIEKKMVDPSRPGKFFSTSRNTVLDIPANAFVDEKGKVVTSPVEVQFIEYNDPVELALSGIPMQIKNEDGSAGDFSSAGMFKLTATSNGQEVFPNPKALINANIYSKQSTPYNLYTFQENKGWILAQSAPINSISPKNLTADNSTIPSEILNSPGIDYSIYDELIDIKKKMGDTVVFDRGVIYEPKVIMKHKKSASAKSFTISFEPVKMYLNSDRQGKQWKYNYPKEMETMLSKQLIYNDYNYSSDVELLDSIKKQIKKSYYTKKNYKKKKRKSGKEEFEWNENVILKDITLTPDPTKDDYILQFNFKGKSHQFHVVINENGNNAAKIQKQNLNYYQNFLFASRLLKETREKELKKYESYYEKREKDLKRNYEKYKKIYDRKMKEYADKIEENGMTIEEYETMKNRASGMVFSFQVANFGITNCDVVARMQKPGRVKASFKDVMGKTLLFLKMIRIDKKMNVITSLDPGRQLDVDYAHDQTGLLFIIDDEHLGIVDSKTLYQHRDDNEIPVKIIKSDELKPEKVRSLL